MSIKSILLLTSLSLILSSQHTMVQAVYPPSGIAEEHDIEAAQSMKSMKPLVDLNQGIVPFSEFESKSSMKNFTLMTQEALNKPEIAGIGTTSSLSTELQDEITNYLFAKRVGFIRPEIGIGEELRNSLKMESLVEAVAKNLILDEEAQDIPGLKRASFLSTEFRDKINSYQFAKRVNFALPEITGAEVARNSSKNESWLESMEKYLEKLAPYLDNYGRYDILD